MSHPLVISQRNLFLALLFMVGLAGCEANGGPGLGNGGDTGGGGPGVGVVNPNDGIDGDGNVEGDGSNTDTGFPNDGTVGGSIEEDGAIIAGPDSDPQMAFVCTRSASLFEGASTEVGANGLVGEVVGGLLGLLGASSVNDLLNSIQDKDLAIDNDLTTAASFTQTLAALDILLGGASVDSLDLSVLMPEGKKQSAGSYAVFGVSFPSSLLDLGLLSSLQVTTLLDGEVQEDSAVFDSSGLSLLGFDPLGELGVTSAYAWVGYKTTLPYDTARVSISSDLLSADLGSNLYVHEMCTGGNLVEVVTP